MEECRPEPDRRKSTHPSSKGTFFDVRFRDVAEIGRVTIMGAERSLSLAFVSFLGNWQGVP
jgi:hypothetical protein